MEEARVFCRVLAVLSLIASVGAALFLVALVIPPYNSHHIFLVPVTSAALLFFGSLSLFSLFRARSARGRSSKQGSF